MYADPREDVEVGVKASMSFESSSLTNFSLAAFHRKQVAYDWLVMLKTSAVVVRRLLL